MKDFLDFNNRLVFEYNDAIHKEVIKRENGILSDIILEVAIEYIGKYLEMGLFLLAKISNHIDSEYINSMDLEEVEDFAKQIQIQYNLWFLEEKLDYIKKEIVERNADHSIYFYGKDFFELDGVAEVEENFKKDGNIDNLSKGFQQALIKGRKQIQLEKTKKIKEYCNEILGELDNFDLDMVSHVEETLNEKVIQWLEGYKGIKK